MEGQPDNQARIVRRICNILIAIPAAYAVYASAVGESPTWYGFVSLIMLVLALMITLLLAASLQWRSPRVSLAYLPSLWVFVGVVVVLFAVFATSFPLMLTFGIYRSQLDAVANRVEAGAPVRTPLSIGPFRIVRVERTDRMVGLWFRDTPSGAAGLLRSATRTYDRAFNPAWQKRFPGGWMIHYED